MLKHLWLLKSLYMCYLKVDMLIALKILNIQSDYEGKNLIDQNYLRFSLVSFLIGNQPLCII